MRLRSFAPLAVAAALFASSAGAQEADPYLVKFQEGRTLLKANRYVEALEKFKESLALKPASGTLLNIGDCYEKLGKYASAMEAFEKALELAAESKRPEHEKEASDRAGKLQAQVSSITVTTPGKDAPKDLKLTVDGNAATFGQPFSVDGGPHVVKVEMTCKRPKSMDITVGKQSDAQNVPFDPAMFEADPSCGPKKEDAPGMSTERLLAYVAGGVGVVSLGVGVGFGIVASGKSSDLEDMCPTYPSRCNLARRTELEDTYDSASSAATISTIGFIGAVVFIGAGAALYFLSPEWKHKTTGRWVPGRLAF